jgi:hypothetical protein
LLSATLPPHESDFFLAEWNTQWLKVYLHK